MSADDPNTIEHHARHEDALGRRKANEDEIDLRELISVLWLRKWFIAGVTAVFAVVSVLVAFWLPSQYTATIVVAPVSSSNLNSIASQLGGLAALAGISLGNGQEDESQTAMQSMQSWDFIDKFIKDNKLQVDVFAVDGWDRETNTLEIDSSLYDVKQKKWVRTPPRGKTIEPTSWELFHEFSKHLDVSQDKKTGLISVSIEYYSPLVAKQWVDMYVAAINEHMRQRKLDESSKNIEYLQDQINKTSIAQMQEVLYQLMENEIKNKMVAAASPQYEFATVSEAMVPEERSAPKRILIIVFSTLFGFMLAAAWVLVRNSFSIPRDA
ncbi:MAG TPA: Wzz/FepE/Etk N-terminal domain-containing protein [Steroidobacteraceae bacterium]|nr:Wzz/FepE/Etk N-terminal domain-containing protein [Steroidobacteraceae bacterium]